MNGETLSVRGESADGLVCMVFLVDLAVWSVDRGRKEFSFASVGKEENALFLQDGVPILIRSRF